MSTILDALQKQTPNQSDGVTNRIRSSYWNMVLFISSLVIIALLVVLIYILLNSTSYAQSGALVVANTPINTVVQKSPKVKVISKVVYLKNLRTIPENKIISQDPKATLVDQPAQVALSSNAVVNEEKKVNMIPKKPLILSGEAKSLLTESQIDYSHVSDELKERFQYALLTNREEGKAIIASENSDGSDIHQMAASFQEKVPAFSYDFHVYSTLLEERWIRINGEDLREGQFDSSGKIEVVEIQPERTFFRYKGQSFSLQSLTNWNGFSHQ